MIPHRLLSSLPASICTPVHRETDVVIDQLEMTGKLEPGSVAALRRAWADQNLATMGF